MICELYLKNWTGGKGILSIRTLYEVNETRIFLKYFATALPS